MLLYSYMFNSIGKNVIFDPNDSFSFETISLGSDVFIGSGAKFSASESSITIGDKVMFGPNVTIMGGDHNITEVGRFMFDVHEKRAENDLPVKIERDCWIGSNATILKGVTIRTGTVVAAGSLVLKSTEPHSIVGGSPAKLLRYRFEDEILKTHIAKLGNRS